MLRGCLAERPCFRPVESENKAPSTATFVVSPNFGLLKYFRKAKKFSTPYPVTTHCSLVKMPVQATMTANVAQKPLGIARGHASNLISLKYQNLSLTGLKVQKLSGISTGKASNVSKKVGLCRAEDTSAETEPEVPIELSEALTTAGKWHLFLFSPIVCRI